MAILTNTLEKSLWTNSENMLYEDKRYKKHVLVRPQVYERFEGFDNDMIEKGKQNNNLHLEQVDGLDLKSAINYLRNTHGYEQLLVECGASTTNQYYYQDLNLLAKGKYGDMSGFDVYNWLPFDTLYLSIYRGPLRPECVGQVFPSMDVISEKMNIL